MNRIRFVLLGLFVLIGAAGSIGCEERVVSTRIRPNTGMKDYRYVPVEKPKPKQGFLEDMGDFLFGWTDDLFEDEPDSSTRTVPQSQWNTSDWRSNTSKPSP